MCGLQMWLTRLCLDARKHKSCLVTVPSSVQGDISFWVTSYVMVLTNVSLLGWTWTSISSKQCLHLQTSTGRVECVCWSCGIGAWSTWALHVPEQGCWSDVHWWPLYQMGGDPSLATPWRGSFNWLRGISHRYLYPHLNGTFYWCWRPWCMDPLDAQSSCLFASRNGWKGPVPEPCHLVMWLYLLGL